MQIVVVMKDPSPEINAGDPAKHRHVHVELTDEQAALIEPRATGEVAGRQIKEVISHVFLED